MSATVITLVFIMVISGVIDGVLMMAGQPHWFMLSTSGDTIATVYGGYELFFGGGALPRGMLPFEIETPDINLCILAMVIYMVVGFLVSIWITRRRQLA
jgi:hypothetical protein